MISSRIRGLLPRTAAVTAIGNSAIFGLNGIAGLIVARGLGPTDRGTLAIAMAWYTIACALGELGTTPAVTYFTARFPADIPQILAGARRLFLALGVFTAVVLAGWALFASHDSQSLLLAALILAALTPVTFQAAVPLFALLAINPGDWNRSRAVQPLTYLLVVAGLWAAGQLTIGLAVVAVVLSTAATILPSYWWLHRRVDVSGPTDPEDARGYSRSILRYGLRSFPSTIPGAFAGRIDVLILAGLLTQADVGEYAVAMTLAAMAMPPATAIPLLVLPRMAAQGNTSNRREHARTSLIASFVIAVVFAALVAALAPWLTSVILGPAYGSVAQLTMILTIAVPAGAVSLSARNIVRGVNRPELATVPEWATLAFSIALILLLVPMFGLVGAAYASVTAAWASAAIYLLAVRRALRRPASHSSNGPAAGER